MNTGSYGYERAIREIEERERLQRLNQKDYENYGTEVEDDQ